MTRDYQHWVRSGKNGQEQLWRAVVVRAVLDVLSDLRPETTRSECRPDPLQKLEALLFLYSQSGEWACWRRWVETAAGVEPGFVDGLVRRLRW